MKKDDAHERTKREFVDRCIKFAPPTAIRERAEHAPAEFDALVACGRFPQLATEDGLLLARTRMVYMRDCIGSWHQIGEFILEIGSSHFKMFNITRTISNCHGPHIRENGDICIDAGKEEIMDLIKRGRLADALLCVEYLAWHTNRGNTGQIGPAKVENWPYATKGELEWIKAQPAPSLGSGRRGAISLASWLASIWRTS